MLAKIDDCSETASRLQMPRDQCALDPVLVGRCARRVALVLKRAGIDGSMTAGWTCLNELVSLPAGVSQRQQLINKSFAATGVTIA